MEITEQERLILVKKKESICALTWKILDLKNDPKNIEEIKKYFTSILSELNTIASYSDSKNYDLNYFTIGVTQLFLIMSKEENSKIWISSPLVIEIACNFANSMRFDFTKKGLKIYFPKINLNFGLITNK